MWDRLKFGVLSGGKFANGAITSAFMKAYNDAYHSSGKHPVAPLAKWARSTGDKMVSFTDSKSSFFSHDMTISVGVAFQLPGHVDGSDMAVYATTSASGILSGEPFSLGADITVLEGGFTDSVSSGNRTALQTSHPLIWGIGARSDAGMYSGSRSPGVGLSAGAVRYTTRAWSPSTLLNSGCDAFLC